MGKLPLMTRVVYFKRAQCLTQQPSICRIFGSRPVYRHVRVVRNGKTGVGSSGKANLAAISCLKWQHAVPKYPHRLLDIASSSGAIACLGPDGVLITIRFRTIISSSNPSFESIAHACVATLIRSYRNQRADVVRAR